MPATWYRMDPSLHTIPRSRATREARYDVLRRLYAAGAKVVTSTDSGTLGTQIDQLPLLMEFLVKYLQLSAMEVIRSATGLAAEAIGCQLDVGTIEPGKKADILIVDGDPLSDITALKRVDKVLKDGEVVVSGGMLKL